MQFEEQIKKNIELIKSLGNEKYARDVLKARRDFLQLRADHEKELRSLYAKAIKNVNKEINLAKLTGNEDTLRTSSLQHIQKALADEIENINEKTEAKMKEGIEEAIQLANQPVENRFYDSIRETGVLSVGKVKGAMVKLNKEAVLEFWNRNRHGMTISQNIWKIGQNVDDNIRSLIGAGLSAGTDSAKIAQALEDYVQDGRETLIANYSNMMDRLEGRVPKDLVYESLRLVRTEYTTAFHNSTIKRGQQTPGYKGVQWVLSDAHPVTDICDTLAETDAYGLGPGKYPKGQEPTTPHPNCLCFLVAILVEREKFIQDLKKWDGGRGEAVDYLDEWYENVYSKKKPLDKISSEFINLAPNYDDVVLEGLEQTHQEVLEHGQKASTERLATLNVRNGEKAFKSINGTKDSVKFPNWLVNELKNADENSIILTHNHPNNSSFSGADLKVLFDFDSLDAITVEGHNNTKYICRIANGKTTLNEKTISQLWQEKRDEYHEFFRKKVTQDGFDSNDVWREHSHITVKELAKELDWEYKRVLTDKHKEIADKILEGFEDWKKKS